jgi:hypothetical protein
VEAARIAAGDEMADVYTTINNYFGTAFNAITDLELQHILYYYQQATGDNTKTIANIYSDNTNTNVDNDFANDFGIGDELKLGNIALLYPLATEAGQPGIVKVSKIDSDNVVGRNLELLAGPSTGTSATGGDIIFKTTNTSGDAGSTANAQSEKMRLRYDGEFRQVYDANNYNSFFVDSSGKLKMVTTESGVSTAATLYMVNTNNSITCNGTNLSLSTTGALNLTAGAASTWTLVDNNASALTIDASGKTGIIKVVTTDSAEGVTMSGTLGVTGLLTLSDGLTVSAGSIIIPDASTIGSASDNDAITISAAGLVTMSAGLTVSDGNVIIKDTANASTTFSIKDTNNSSKFSVASASGNTSVSGTLEVTDTTTMSSALTINGTDTENSFIVTSSTNTNDYFALSVDADGATTLSTVDNASNAAVFTLDIDGTIIMNSKDTITDAVLIDGTTVTLGGALNVTGLASLDGGIDVDGSFTVADTTGNIVTTGTLQAATGSTIGNLTLANGSITDSSGAISFDNENLTTTGNITSASLITGTLTVTDGSITDTVGSLTLDGASGINIAGNASEIDITTTGLVDINGNTVNITSTANSSSALYINSTGGGALWLNSTGDIFIDADTDNHIDLRQSTRLDIANKNFTPQSDGLSLHVDALTYTDNNTAQDGTAAQSFSEIKIEAPTIASSNTGVTTTNAYTLFISNAPQAGNNMTITNPYALYIGNGDTFLGSTLILDIYDKNFTPQSDGLSLHVDALTYTDNSTAQDSIAAEYFSQIKIEAPTIASSNTGVTLEKASSLFIDGAPKVGNKISIDNTYSLLVNGDAKFETGAIIPMDGQKIYTIEDRNNGTWTQLGADIDGEAASDESGIATAINGRGNIVAIGAFYNDGNGGNAGHTRIYYYNDSGSWTQLGADIDGEAAGDNSGLDVSLNALGNIVAIGAQTNAGGGASAGHVRVYKYDEVNTQWSQLGSDIDGAAGYGLGISLQLNAFGNRFVVGAAQANTFVGLARVYEYSAGSWSQMGDDITIGAALLDLTGFGTSMSSDGNIVAVAAPGDTNGKVEVYEWSETTAAWSQIGSTLNGPSLNSSFGNSVSLSADGKIIAVGAPNTTNGNVYVYKYDNSTDDWTLLDSGLTGAASGDNFGTNVCLNKDGTTLAVSAFLHDSERGHIRVYKFLYGTWTQIGSDIDGEATGDRLGASLSLNYDGSTLIGGAPLNDGTGSNAGHARVYQLGKNISNINSFGTNTITADQDSEFIALKLINQSDAADTTGIVSLEFDLEDTSGNAVDSGKIAVKKEQSFTSTASTQDSEMVFSTSKDGTLTERVTITSDGRIEIVSGSSSNNVIIGTNAGSAAGTCLTALGNNAGQYNSGNTNTFIGCESGVGSDGSSTAANNSCLGHQSGTSITTGGKNTLLGAQAGSALTTGFNNVVIGYQAGNAMTATDGTNSNSYNVIIGQGAGTSLNSSTVGEATNNIIIGRGAEPSAATASNEITLGNSSITSLRCADTTIASLSDRRDKTDIKDSTYGIDFINTLKPREFTWQTREGVPTKDGKSRVGFIAQELQDAMPNGQNDILDLVYEANPDRLEAKYGNLVPVLVKAVQDLSQLCEGLSRKVAELEARLT